MLAALIYSCAFWQGTSTASTEDSPGVIESSSTCKTHASRNQNWETKMPAILVADVGTSCAYEEYGSDHNNVCISCAELHAPCDGKFVGCSGCDPERKATKDIPNKIDCDVLVEWVIKENTCQVAQQAEGFSEAITDETYKTDFGTQETDTSAVNGSQVTLTSGCRLDVGPAQWMKLPKLPALLYFQCQQCNQGNPTLMKECCDHCVEFSQSPQVMSDSTQGFTVCVGCEVTKLNDMEDDWKYAGLYDDHSEKQAKASLSSWVRDAMTSSSPGSCASNRRMEKFNRSRRLEEACELDGDWESRCVRATLAWLVACAIVAMVT